MPFGILGNPKPEHICSVSSSILEDQADLEPQSRQPNVAALTLSIEGLIFQGFWAQRPDYIRLLGYFDAKGNN